MGTFIENSRTQQLQSKLLSLTVCLFCGETEVSFIFLYFIFLSVLLAIVNLPPWYVKVIINLYKFYKLYTLFIIIILFFFLVRTCNCKSAGRLAKPEQWRKWR